MKKNYYKIFIAYDGSNYCGWQIQKNGPSVHQALMDAGRVFLKDEFTITGCSRTDSGVHALNYTALLVTTSNIPMRKISNAFNAALPSDIVVHGCELTNDTWHPRYCTHYKHYRYQIYNNRFPIPQYLHYSHYYYKELDLEAMSLAAKSFLGRHDFVGFSSAKTTVTDTTRTITDISVTRDNNLIKIDITGDGFLYNMVRIIAGTLMQVGLHQINANDMDNIIASKDRNLAKKTAPANGLTLVDVFYAN